MSYPSDPASAGYPATPPGPGGPPPGVELAHWGLRFVATLIDLVPFLVLYLISIPLLRGDAAAVGWVLLLAALAWLLYMAYLTGARGQSIGKKVMNIKVVKELDGQVIGGGLGIARYFIHIVDSLPCYLGYLWPLWDQKKQTFTDKIMGTLAIKV